MAYFVPRLISCRQHRARHCGRQRLVLPTLPAATVFYVCQKKEAVEAGEVPLNKVWEVRKWSDFISFEES